MYFYFFNLFALSVAEFAVTSSQGTRSILHALSKDFACDPAEVNRAVEIFITVRNYDWLTL